LGWRVFEGEGEGERLRGEKEKLRKKEKARRFSLLSRFSFIRAFRAVLLLYLLRNGAQLRVAQRRLGQGHRGRGLDAVRGVVFPGDDVGEGGRGVGGSGAANAAVLEDAALREGVCSWLLSFFFVRGMREGAERSERRRGGE
jgi:hypothetical protein